MINGQVTRAMTRRIAKEAEEKVALFRKSINGLACYTVEEEEIVQESSKILLVFKVQEGAQEN